MPIPTQKRKSPAMLPVMMLQALGTAKIRKKASFFSKKPGSC